MRIPQDVIDKNANGSREVVQRIVKSDDGVGLEETGKSVEVGLSACIGVVAIDPEETDGPLPGASDIGGECAMNFDVLFDLSGAEREEEIVVGGGQRARCRAGGEFMRVRVYGNDGAKTVVRGDFGEHYRGAALETADFDNCALCGNARGKFAEEARFVFEKKAGDVLCHEPGVMDDLIQVLRQCVHVSALCAASVGSNSITVKRLRRM